MADTKISGLAPLLAVDAAGADYLPVVDASLVAGSPATANKRMTLTELAAFVGSGAGGGDTLLIGTVAPTTEGVDGDFYYRITTGENWGPKTAGSWGSPISNLTGESWFSRQQTVSIVSGVVTVDYTAGRLVVVPVTANITSFVINNFPADGLPGSLTFRFMIGAGGPFTIAWPTLGTVIRAEEAAVPVVPTTNGAVLMVTMFSNDARATTDLLIGASNLLPV
jgi:hypothetical protein